MIMDGLFQIIKYCDLQLESNNFEVIGTAFSIQTPQAGPCEYYLLTAYHNISESFVKNEKIFVRSIDDVFYSTEIMYPTMFRSFSSYCISDDFALLRLVTGIEYDRYAIGQVALPSKCYIRGAAHYFNSITKMTPFQGEILGCEYTVGFQSEEILVLDISTKSVFDSQTDTYVNQQEIIEGMSGSPIIVIQEQTAIVVGVFVRLFHDGSASKCYGVPISSIINKCLYRYGLYCNSFLNTYKMNECELQLCDLRDVDIYIDLLFEDPATFSLEDCSQESRIWDKISNQFYHGFAVDATLYRAIESDRFRSYSYDAQVAVRYYLARLLFKRGRRQAAYEQFSQISIITKHMNPTVTQRISTLLTARSTVESEIKQPQDELDQIRHCRDRLSYLQSVDDIYVSNELASVIGRGLVNFFGQLQKLDYSYSIKGAIKDIFNEHSKLLKKYPIPLQKQDIVNTSLSWLTNLWGIWQSTDAEKLVKDVLTGLQQAVKRRNSIFHIQSLIAYSTSLLITGKTKQALTALFLSVLLMRKKGLKASHEGIAQLLHYIEIYHSVFFPIFQLYFDLCNENEKTFLKKSSLYSIGISPSVIGSLVQKSHYILDTIYLPLGADIFFASANDVFELL